MITKTEWGGRRGAATVDSAPKTEGYIHHTVSAGTFSTFSQQCAHMRALQRMHMDTNGWADIGYSFVVFPATKWYKRTRIFEGRGWNKIPAAQEGHNTGTIAVAVVGNFENQAPGRKLVGRLSHFWKRARKQHGIKTLHGHREAPGQSTACPGKNLMSVIPEIRRKAGF